MNEIILTPPEQLDEIIQQAVKKSASLSIGRQTAKDTGHLFSETGFGFSLGERLQAQ